VTTRDVTADDVVDEPTDPVGVGSSRLGNESPSHPHEAIAVEYQRDREEQGKERGHHAVRDCTGRVGDGRGVHVEPLGKVVEPLPHLLRRVRLS
jgi:hypothetical protein